MTCCFRARSEASAEPLGSADAPSSSQPASYSATANEELRRSFEHAASSLSLRGGRPSWRGGGASAEPAVLRHPEASPPCARRPRAARLTTALALGADEGGAKCVNQYVKQRALASGSYAKVGLYTSRESGRQFAVKVLNKPLLERKYVSRNANALTDVLNEASCPALCAPFACAPSVLSARRRSRCCARWTILTSCGWKRCVRRRA
jgi:hypothetical protein